MADTPGDEVRSITVDRDSHLEVAFADGMIGRIQLVELRQACPCAACRNVRDRGQTPWPPGGGPAPELTVADAALVGAWGLGITWSDGHSTGIYPFESLRRWCESGDPGTAFRPDSGLG